MTEYAINEFGIDINNDPSYEDFEQAVTTATNASNGACWALGDLYELSRQREDYAQAFDECKKSLKTLQNYATVCKTFPKHRRKFSLSFSHYSEVKSIRDDKGNPLEHVQDQLLRQAVKDGLNREDFRDIVRVAKGTISERQTVEAQVGVIDSLLQKDYGLPPGTIVKVSFVIEVPTEESEAAA